MLKPPARLIMAVAVLVATAFPSAAELVVFSGGHVLKVAGFDLTGDAVELQVTFASPLPAECGVHLLADDRGQSGISIVTGAERKSLRVGTIEAPFQVGPDEDLTLRVFIDKNLVEVFAGDRQAAVFAHKHIRDNPNIRLFAGGGDAVVKSAKAWKLKSIYEKASADGAGAGQ